MFAVSRLLLVPALIVSIGPGCTSEPEADPLNSIFDAAAGHLFFDGDGDDGDGGGGRVSSSSDRPRPIPPTNVHVPSPECPGSVRFFSEATQLKSNE